MGPEPFGDVPLSFVIFINVAVFGIAMVSAIYLRLNK
jgi:hypothetical protein